ncbi:Aste57867_15420 [Aphanomyces stellatus]|uniref:Aste57867_15420 protein n=1 Tax=Aphanomyces stellatus TaxID=120398 RepID=A0A485L335_9STRA|nr:hypothetical protein As57867_015364 [Aphanomyces stellatus]VFT92222.1 Aste57867_15420 [Aphanomyces stellatus]
MLNPATSFTTISSCHFNKCPHPAQPGTSKCYFHRHRAMCLTPDCTNQVYARNLCTRHGGKRQCAFDGCHQHARVHQFCTRHGVAQVKKLCVHDGCTKLANARQRCVRHGGGRQCKVNGCGTHARSGGYCRRHSNQNHHHECDFTLVDDTNDCDRMFADLECFLKPLDLDASLDALDDSEWMANTLNVLARDSIEHNVVFDTKPKVDLDRSPRDFWHGLLELN